MTLHALKVICLPCWRLPVRALFETSTQGLPAPQGTSQSPYSGWYTGPINFKGPLSVFIRGPL